jgi:hypothetical protein
MDLGQCSFGNKRSDDRGKIQRGRLPKVTTERLFKLDETVNNSEIL